MPIMSTMFYVAIYAFAFLFTSARAIPVVTRDVVDPPITNPTASTVWHVGEKQTVTWDTSGLPPFANITNPQGKVVLGFLTSESENLMLGSPLAENFLITAGKIDIVVPDVAPKDNYIIALMGDSGNISPTFTIAASPGSPLSESAFPSSIATTSPSTVPASSSATPSSTPVVTPSSTAVVESLTEPLAVTDSLLSSLPLSSPLSSLSPSSLSSSSLSTTPSPISGATANTNGALSFKEINLFSIAFTALAAFFMI